MQSTQSGQIAVLNAGSATVKGAIFASEQSGPRCLGRVTRDFDAASGVAPHSAFEDVFEFLAARSDSVFAVGHRIVHGGSELSATVEIDDAVERRLDALGPLAPLHNPVSSAGIRAARERFPRARQVAVFDTAFHAGRSAASLTYPLPQEIREEYGFRRFGFHGIAHAALADALVEETGIAPDQLAAVTLQLGSGCSACAIRQGRSIETSMGFSPLGGLPMGTRPGDLDPGVLLALVRDGWTADQLERLLTRESGLAGLAGRSNMRDIEIAAAKGDERAELALSHFVRAVVMWTGAFLTLLRGEGAIVFGGGIGRYSASIRERVGRGLSAWDVEIDRHRNDSLSVGRISKTGTRPVYVFETDEEERIARETRALLQEGEA